MAKWRLHDKSRARGRLVTRLMARDGAICTLCGGELDRKVSDPDDPLYVTLDHKVTRSAGGATEFSNLQLAHRLCNWTRGNDPLDEGTEP